MATVVLPPALATRIEGDGSYRVEGTTAGDVLRALEKRQPSLRGWILDETGSLREHVALFVNNQKVTLGRPVNTDDELYIVQAISGGAPDTGTELELLIGTKKGLFVLSGIRGRQASVAKRLFAGQTVDYACFDCRSDTYFATVTHGQFGPHLYFSDSVEGDWREATGPAFPADSGTAVERIWIVEPGAREGELWAGVAPAALFHSTDNGRTWQLDKGLWEQPTRPDWGRGLGGQALHSICPWPDEPQRLAVGISAAGVWLTEDSGKSWYRGSEGLVPRYLPPEARQDTLAHCVHKMLRAPRQPETLFMQFHGGVYISDNGGRSWSDIGTDTGLPADFGFPLAIDPADPNRAFVIPLAADVDRVTPEGRVRVYETRDRGGSWQPLASGLPQKDAYLTVLRQAFCQDGQDPLGLYFGTRSGEVFGSADSGATWLTVIDHLPPIVAVQPGKTAHGSLPSGHPMGR